MAVLTNLNH